MNSKQQRMTAGKTVRPIAALLALSVLLCAGSGASGAITMTVNPDTVNGATVNIQGFIPELTDSIWGELMGPTVLGSIGDESANGAYMKWRVFTLSGGVNWEVDARIYAIDYYDVNDNHLGFTYDLSVDAQHMIVPHDPGDLAPNPLTLLVQQNNLLGLTVSEPLTSVWLATGVSDDEELHPNLPGHKDTAHLAVTDLNGTDPGYILMTTNGFHAVVTLAHVPEPASLSLLALGGLAILRRRK